MPSQESGGEHRQSAHEGDAPVNPFSLTLRLCRMRFFGDPPQFEGHVMGGLDSLVGILRYTCADQPVEREWRCRLQLSDGLWFVFKDRGDQTGFAGAAERRVAGHHLV